MRRPWQHVLEPLSGYLQLGARLLDGDRAAAEAWNFGPDVASGERPVRWVVERLARMRGLRHLDSRRRCRPAAPRGASPEPGQHQGSRAARLGPVWDAADGHPAHGDLVPRVPPGSRRGPRPGRTTSSRLPGGCAAAGLAWAGALEGMRDRDTLGRRATRDEILDLVRRYYRERHAPAPFDPGRIPFATPAGCSARRSWSRSWTRAWTSTSPPAASPRRSRRVRGLSRAVRCAARQLGLVGQPGRPHRAHVAQAR